MNSIAVSGEKRVELGKKGARSTRKAGLIPCVLYGGEDVIHFSTNFNDIKELIYTSKFNLAEITIDGQVFKSIIKSVQYHPVNDEILHIDFLQLVPGKKLNAEIPIVFEGSAPGEKVGGKLLQKLRRVKVKTDPEHLVADLKLNISSLELGQSARVRDIQIPDEMELMSSPGIPVATIEVPRALRSAKAAEAEAEG